jgi:hypothetical protein
LAEEKRSSITKQEWLSVCKHIHEVENKYVQNEHLVKSSAEELILSLESSGSDTSDDEDFGFKGISSCSHPDQT